MIPTIPISGSGWCPCNVLVSGVLVLSGYYVPFTYYR